MPQRTNQKQRTILLLRQLLAGTHCSVEESAMLTDVRTGISTEVDIVMLCVLNDLEVTVSFEVVGQKRKPGTPWVHQ